MEELIFTGINVKAFINNALNQVKENITKGMSENELRAFDFGIDTAISQLEQFSNIDQFVVLAGNKVAEEFTLDDLLEMKDLKYDVEYDEDENGNEVQRILVYSEEL